MVEFYKNYTMRFVHINTTVHLHHLSIKTRPNCPTEEERGENGLAGLLIGTVTASFATTIIHMAVVEDLYLIMIDIKA